MTSFGTVGLIKSCQANHNLVSIETKYTVITRVRGHRTIQEAKWVWSIETNPPGHDRGPGGVQGVSLGRGHGVVLGCLRAP